MTNHPTQPVTHIDSFVKLSPAGTQLTDIQLESIFSGDLTALNEIVQFAYTSNDTAE